MVGEVLPPDEALAYLNRYVGAYVRWPIDLDDVVQDTLEQMLRTGRVQGAPRAYLWKTLRFRAITHARYYTLWQSRSAGSLDFYWADPEYDASEDDHQPVVPGPEELWLAVEVIKERLGASEVRGRSAGRHPAGG